MALWEERPLEHGMVVKPKESVWIPRRPNQGSKGNSKNGTGKGAGSLEQGDHAAAVEQQPQPALASSLDLAWFETPGRSPHLDPKVG